MTKKHKKEHIKVHTTRFTEKEYRTYFCKPYPTSKGDAYVYNSIMHVERGDAMEAWRYRRPNDVEMYKMLMHFPDMAFESGNLSIICRTQTEIRVIKNAIKKFYKLNDIDDRSIIGVPMKVIFGEFIDEDELFGEIIINMDSKKYATFVPANPDNVPIEFPEIFDDPDTKRIAIDLRTPIPVKNRNLTLV